MEILVCVKRVPDAAENEIEVNRDGSDIERDDLVYSVNEWDNYAVEEAIQIRDKVGGSVTVVTVGEEEDEDINQETHISGVLFFNINFSTSSKTVPYIAGQWYQSEFKIEKDEEFSDYSYANIGFGIRNFYNEYRTIRKRNATKRSKQ